MINELTDEQILEYLMTAEFIENYKPEEYKFLLHKFRYFYRILHGNHTRIKSDNEFSESQLKSEIESIRKQLTEEQTKSSDLRNQIDLSMKSRKLTWKERWDGKINQF
jgi:lantibiotic modifying enzyme